MALMLILIYGIIIPSLLDIDKFILWTTKISVFFVLGSFLCFPFFYQDMIKGGRFIGFFKHIPHMVSASTASYILFFPRIYDQTKWTLKNNTPLKLLILFILGLSVLMTSTKAAFVTMAITTFIGFFIFGPKTKNVRLFKVAFFFSFAFSALLLGAPAADFAYKIATGKTDFGLRRAQDGIHSRMEEITRGEDLYAKSPYFGLGLLYKFLNNRAEGIAVEGYNSFKDPHNLFISAAVIGGPPLFLFAIFSYLFMLGGAIKAILFKNERCQLIGVFLLSHLPVFVIYHAHFSIGGMADRLYWLIFGYLGVYLRPRSTNTEALLKRD